MNRTPQLSEAAQVEVWRKEIAATVADQLRPELEKQTAILERLLEVQVSGTESNQTLIAAAVADQLRPEIQKQTAILSQMLEMQVSTTESNQTLIAALKQRFGI